MEILARSSCQRQSINVILALSNKGGFWCHVYSGKFTADKCVEYFQRLLRNRKPPVILIVDTHPVNKSKKVMEYIKSLWVLFPAPWGVFSFHAPAWECIWRQCVKRGTVFYAGAWEPDYKDRIIQNYMKTISSNCCRNTLLSRDEKVDQRERACPRDFYSLEGRMGIVFLPLPVAPTTFDK